MNTVDTLSTVLFRIGLAWHLNSRRRVVRCWCRLIGRNPNGTPATDHHRGGGRGRVPTHLDERAGRGPGII